MGLLLLTKIGGNREARRLWIESARLNALGFTHGTPLEIRQKADGLILRPTVLAENHVSSRIVAGGRRPIIDLANQSLLSGLSDYSEVKVIAAMERIEILPSHRASAIRRSQKLEPPCRVFEVFTGGGTMTDAIAGNETFQVVGGIEIEPDFADEWQGRHQKALLIQADIRSILVSDLPEFDVLIGGIPCTSHSTLGRAKKKLSGRPEAGDSGDLFLSVLKIVSERMPAAVVFENVPSFGESLAGDLMVNHLKRAGYHVFTTILRPNEDWGEIEDRKRWLLVGTLNRPFQLTVPHTPSVKPLSTFLDAPNDELDKADAERIANTVEALEAHHRWHKQQSHGFGFTVADGLATWLPTIPASYHKINTGPFVETPYGPRLLRKTEIERIHGCNIQTPCFSTAVRMLGQGVQTRLFREVFRQLGINLLGESLGK